MLFMTDGSLPLLWSPLLHAVPGVWHAFTTRQGGVSEGPFAALNLSMTTGDDVEAVEENRRRLAQAAGVSSSLIRLQTQLHGADVVEAVGEQPAEPLVGDAFVTDQSGVPLLVGVADCAPVLFASDDGRVVAVAHAGWRGALAGVIRSTVETLRSRYGVAPDRLCAAIGPAIGLCCFEVGNEVAARFDSRHVARGTPGRSRVDLPGAVFAHLLEVGLRSERVDRTDLCTRCRQDLFYSHRGSGGLTGRMVGMIFRT